MFSELADAEKTGMNRHLKHLMESTIFLGSRLILRNRTKRLVLAYHNLAESSHGTLDARKSYVAPDLNVTVDALEKQLHWLAGFAEFVSLDRMLADMEKPLPSGRWQVAVTFDDAYANVIKLGLPLLREYTAPTTIFVSAAFVEDRTLLPWWDLLAFIAAAWNDDFEVTVDGETMTFNLQKEIEKSRFLLRLSTAFYNAASAAKQTMQHTLEEKVKKRMPLPQNDIVSPRMLGEATSMPGVDIGSHTATHINTAKASVQELRAECKGNQDKLHTWTGRNARYFAYPYGKPAFRNATVASELKRFGFDAAFTTDYGYLTPHTDRFEIPRVSVEGAWRMSTFKSRTASAALYGRIMRY